MMTFLKNDAVPWDRKEDAHREPPIARQGNLKSVRYTEAADETIGEGVSRVLEIVVTTQAPDLPQPSYVLLSDPEDITRLLLESKVSSPYQLSGKEVRVYSCQRAYGLCVGISADNL